MGGTADDSNLIGITATIPVEIVLAAGFRPLDLNNVFITSQRPEKLVSEAESAGFSHNICAWIKGIYSTVLNHGIKTVVAVTGGDCSNTIALAELLSRKGIRVVTFEYPLNRDRDFLAAQMEKLRRTLGAEPADVLKVRERLNRIRTKLKALDRLTYKDGLVTGLENHLFLVGSSDFNTDPDTYEKELDAFLVRARKRKPRKNEIRLGYLGVPPIFSQFYECVEAHGARVVFNEVQRQFSMPYESEELVDLYLQYTYPYGSQGRIEDISHAVKERDLDGLIHYTQTFCYRQIYDMMLRESLPLPMLTLEGDRPGIVDGRTSFRVETFIEILKDKKAASFSR